MKYLFTPLRVGPLLLTLALLLAACGKPTATTPPTTAPATAAPAETTVAPAATANANGLTIVDETTIVGPKNFTADYTPTNADGTLNFVVEIPTGTNAKWEVSPDGTKLAWEIKNGKPRVIQYLGYVGNYGMIPQTKGGDLDTLDVLALGPALERGTIAQAKLIAVLKYREDDPKTGNEDDKLLAILPGSPLYDNVNSLKYLNEKYPEVSTIVSTWFNNYKGPGTMFFQSYGDVADAKAVLDEAITTYTKK